MLSRRVRGALGVSELHAALAARRAAASDWVDLTTSNPTRVALPEGERELATLLGRLDPFPYEPDPRGELAARAWAASRWAARGVAVTPDQIVLTASTSEGYSLLFKALCDPGDVVLAPRPSYPLIEHLAALEGVRVVTYPLLEADGHRVDVDALRRAVTPEVRAVVAVSPNNPTGSSLSADELEALADLGVPILSDEVFAEFPLDAPVGPAALTVSDRALVVALDGLSKRAAAPQLKLGWLTVGGPKAAAAELLEALAYVADSFLSASTVAMRLAPALGGVESLRGDAVRCRCRRNLAALRAAAAGTAVSVGTVGGGWSVVLRVPRVLSDAEWALALADAGVGVHPGYFYDFDEEGRVVISLLPAPERFDLGVGRLLTTVAAQG